MKPREQVVKIRTKGCSSSINSFRKRQKRTDRLSTRFDCVEILCLEIFTKLLDGGERLSYKFKEN